MLYLLKDFCEDESGLGTVEIVVILAVLVSLAMIFRNQVIGFVRTSLGTILGDTVVDVEN